MKASRNLFGTDGVRGVANEHPMTSEVALKLGRAIAHISKRGNHRHRIVVGKDTRMSGYMLEFAICSGVCSFGVDVTLIGPMPTPAVAFLTRTLRADAGIMISASHNPFQDNGIKFFGADGFKLADDIEAEMESLLNSGEIDRFRPTALDIGKVDKMEDARGRYIQYVKSIFDRKLSLEGLRIVVDCAHGAAYRVAPQTFEELGATVVRMGVEPDGKNINADCGATAPQRLQQKVVQSGAHVGLALDGDADRLIVVDEKGRVVDGDAVMALCAADLMVKRALPRATVVATVMSNLGLDRYLQGHGVDVIRTAVGDRYVVECMRENGYGFGGEQSGHIICLAHASTGDGCVAALMILELMVRSGRPLGELTAAYQPVPQHLLNVQVRSKPPLESLSGVQRALQGTRSQLGEDGRVLVRYSGTENKARILVEGPDPSRNESLARELAEVLRREIAAG
ncbi:MAG TPA: phosphoglucosamine mutase [Myxococcales bacterium LLY-WYZ-16_1]|nr:phosphoglucosamine mutase [Myxococcales bacterium LLY-WYZ-16_1]